MDLGNEEDQLLDDILDLQEGGEPLAQDEDVEGLLKSDDDESQPDKTDRQQVLDSKSPPPEREPDSESDSVSEKPPVTPEADSNGSDARNDSDVEMMDEAEEKPKKDEPELVELSSDEEAQEEDEEEEEEEEESEDDEVGDPSKPAGEGADKTIDPDHLLPFHHGWRREVVMRQKEKNSAHTCDIYYIPPEDSEYRTREAKRKRRSKMDQVQYFEDFPHKVLAIQHFSYVRRPLGLGNAAYEIVRKAKRLTAAAKPTKPAAAKRYKDKEESESDNESLEEEDEEVAMINGFNTKLPICLQADNQVHGLRAERKKRKKFRDPETACTPPLAEDLLWTALDDDPLGVYTDLGGSSSPATPPPLRAVKLTPNSTAEKINKLISEVKSEASKLSVLKEQDLQENLASHDQKIKKFKHVRPVHYRAAFSKVPQQIGGSRQQTERRGYHPQQQFGGNRQSLLNPAIQRMRQLKSLSVQRVSDCGPRCLGGQQPSLECISCHKTFHARCQGVSRHVRVFKCKSCQSNPNESGSVKIKLPMNPVNGKRPVVELVMLQNGKYRPIKFSNNMTVTETIPRRIFNQANSLRKTIYQRAKQIPLVGNKPIYCAINPTNPATGNALRTSGNKQTQPTNPSPQSQPNSDQVSILVRLANTNTKPVLLNVPRKVACKVKKGTTLSFSASSDQKYIVVDNTIHPPLKNSANRNATPPQPKQKAAPAVPYQRIRKPGMPFSLPGGLSISRTNTRPSQPPPPSFRRQQRNFALPSGNVLSSGEV